MGHHYFNIINDVHFPANSSFEGSHSDPISSQDADGIYAVKLMRNIGIPLITILGLLGNSLSLLVYSAIRTNTSPPSIFLAALSLADNVFLVCLLVTWIDGAWYTLIRHDTACQVLVFTSYVAKCLSVWFIVGFSFERFIAICFPLKNKYLCSVFREKVAVLTMTVAACIFYSNSFFTSGMQTRGDYILCSHSVKMSQILEISTWVDSVLTMFMPFVLVASINTKVLYTVLACNQRSAIHRNNNNEQGSGSSPERTSSIRSRARHRLRLTWALLLVSTSLLLLYLPSYVIRTYSLIWSITHQHEQTGSSSFFVLQEVTLMLYYFTFSCNFIVYTVFGKNFISSLRAILQCKTRRESYSAVRVEKAALEKKHSGQVLELKSRSDSTSFYNSTEAD